MRLDDLVEGALHVEHHGVQFAARRVVDALHPARDVVERVDAHRLGEPAGRVDREHDDLAAPLGRAQPQGGRRRRLPDTAGPAAHHDAGPRVVEQRVDVQDTGGADAAGRVLGPGRIVGPGRVAAAGGVAGTGGVVGAGRVRTHEIPC